MDILLILGLTLTAGMAMPLGAWLAQTFHWAPDWLESELRHGIMAFGGGALLSAVALVLVPKGMTNLTIGPALLCFGGGGLAFMLLDVLLAKLDTSASQLLAMLSDFIPESLALGATLLGPVAGLSGYFWLTEMPTWVAAIMLFAGGGILYSVFQDIAPQVLLESHWAPPLGAVLGFALGIAGFMLTEPN